MKRTLLATALALCVAQIAHGKIVDDKKALEIITDGRLIYSQGFKEPATPGISSGRTIYTGIEEIYFGVAHCL
jgi:O-methyltransferase involved in polyketide biosynthesis